MVSRKEVTDGTELARRVKECSATVMQATPSTWRMLIDSGWHGSQEFQILCGGESLSRELANALLTRGEVWNLYGPTETTIWSMVHKVESGEGPVAIGHPIANTQVYVLDSRFQPVPLGVHGELYIGGYGLARGHLNQLELTAEKFIVNPFAPGERLYRTGDRARYLADSNVEFLGRLDNQVKIRGYRIELGEIEAALNQHPAVKNGVVVARDDAILERSGEPDGMINISAARLDRESEASENPKSLIAYIVPKQQRARPSGELREYLKGELPEYMIPSLFVTLDALPLTVNGKVDRNRLPAPRGGNCDINQDFTESRTEIEELVAQAWCEILNTEKVGIRENFFEIGGHSLVAIQIVARLRNTFDREIPLRALFDAPTVEDLSREIEILLMDGDQPAVPAIVPAPREEPLRLAINQEHLWRLHRMVPDTHFFNMPYVYRLSGTLNIGALERSLGEIINRHEALRTVFVELGNSPAQVINPPAEFVLPYFDLRASNAAKVSQRIGDFVIDERNNGFDLAEGPLLRAKLLRATDTEHFLLLTLHHIIGDLASVHILRREMTAFYDAFSHGRSLPFTGFPMQFGDFVAWERQYLESERGREAYKYWSTELKGCLPCLPLGEKSDRSVALHQGRFVRERKKAGREAKRDVPAGTLIARRMPLTIHENLFSAIRNFARRQQGTPFLVALTALAALIHRWTCQQDIRIGTLVANRTRREIEGTIGHFINTIVTRARIDRAMTLDQLFWMMRRKVMLGYVHQELPFEYLARELNQKEMLPRASLFNVLLIYRRGTSTVTQLPGLSIAPIAVRQTAPGSGLTISVYELVFELTEESTKLTGTINYRVDKLSSDSVKRLRNKFQELLKSIISDLGARVDGG